MATTDHNLLQAALAGYQHHLDKINQRITELRRRLGNTAGEAAAPAKRRTMSTAARRKIAAAQRKRWAQLKSKKAEPAKPKRKMSAAARKRLALAMKRRWAKAKKAGSKRLA